MDGKNPVLSFVGFNVTAECNFDPKCAYCNQPEIASSVDADGWKAVITDVAGDQECSSLIIDTDGMYFTASPNRGSTSILGSVSTSRIWDIWTDESYLGREAHIDKYLG